MFASPTTAHPCSRARSIATVIAALADRLPETLAAIQRHERAGVHDDPQRPPGNRVPRAHVLDVRRREPDAVRVVPEEVRLHETAGDLRRLAGRAAERLEYALGPVDQRLRGDGDCGGIARGGR